jgi:hypothetical protein
VRQDVAVNRGLRKSVLDMVRTMLVIIAAVGLLVLLVPRPNSVTPPSIDLTSAVSQAEGALGFAPLTPVPPGWTVTSARIRRDTGDLPSWTINYLTPRGGYVGLVQAAGWSARWQSSLTHGGEPLPSVQAGGVVWETYYKQERGLTSLLRREPGRSILVLAKGGGLADATALAAQLAQLDRRPASTPSPS